MKYLVTGANGYIGRNFVERFCSAKNKNIRLVCPYREHIPDLEGFDAATVDFKKTNIFERSIDRLLDQKPTFDRVVHLAWPFLNDFMDPRHLTIALPQSIEFINRCVQHGIKNFTIVGTCLEYGKRSGELAETMVSDPQVPYAIAKDALRRHIFDLATRQPLNIQWVRLFYSFGKYQKTNALVPKLTAAINDNAAFFDMSDTNQLRDYLEIETIADHLRKLTFSPFTGIVNICSGRPTSLRQLAENIITANKSNICLRSGKLDFAAYESFAFWGNNKLMNRILREPLPQPQ
jgi:nucleoside-diphosphate-sugar epimerase